MTGNGVRTVVLLGSDLPELDVVEVAAPSEDVAGVISRGRHPKGYPHDEPNEDALLMATHGTSSLTAVADGHGGIAAARSVVETLAASAAEILESATRGGGTVEEGVVTAVRYARAAVGRSAERHPRSDTTLSLWLSVGPWAAGGSVGDSAAVHIHRRPWEVPRSGGFIGGSSSDAGVRRRRIRTGDWLVVMSDGIADFLRHPWTRTLRDLARSAPTPVDLAADLAERALAGGAGDNLAAVVRRI